MTTLMLIALPYLKGAALFLANILFGMAVNYIRKKVKIELTAKQEKQIWELAKRYVFQMEEKSERLKKQGGKMASGAKSNEVSRRLCKAAGISFEEAESFIDAVLVDTGLAAVGKKKALLSDFPGAVKQ